MALRRHATRSKIECDGGEATVKSSYGIEVRPVADAPLVLAVSVALDATAHD